MNRNKTSKNKRILKRILLTILALGAAGALTVLIINMFMMGKYKGKILSQEDMIDKKFDCILVLGAKVWDDNRPSHMLEDRLNQAIELYKAGYSDRILMSGDHGRKEYDEVNVMKQYAMDKGVKGEHIFMDHAGFSTYESMYRARDVFQVKSVIIVTQGYHLYRGLYIANELGLDAYGVPSDPRQYVGQTMRDIREAAARVKDFFGVLFRVKPTYLGESIPITGSGNLTDDKINDEANGGTIESVEANSLQGNKPDVPKSEEDSLQGNNISDNEKYEYINPQGNTMESRILPPEGYVRAEAGEDSLAAFLRKQELKSHGSPVLLYNGREKGNQSAQAAVFAMDVGSSDLQQCADSIIRLYGEYYWSTGAYDKIGFHLTSGFYMDYTNWRNGSRIQVDGNQVRWVKTKSYNDSYESFREYLKNVMVYAGTLSLEGECIGIEADKIQVGDMLIKGGSPGHCILVADIAENETGERCYLLAQGYMPAQEFHILNSPFSEENPWYYKEDFKGTIRTPEYTFREENIKRWGEGF
jgi:vancomycin permeability regulator SanA